MREDHLNYETQERKRVPKLISKIVLFILGAVIIFFTDIIKVDKDQVAIRYQSHNPMNPQLLGEGYYFNFANLLAYKVYNKMEYRELSIPVIFLDAVHARMEFTVVIDFDELDRGKTSGTDLYLLNAYLDNPKQYYGLFGSFYTAAGTTSKKYLATNLIEKNKVFHQFYGDITKAIDVNNMAVRKKYLSYNFEKINYEEAFMRNFNANK